MITISTGGIGPMDIMSNTKSKGTNKEDKAADAFASLMNIASNKKEQPELASATNELDVSEVTQTKDFGRDYESYSKQEAVDVTKDKYKDVEKTSVKEDTETAKTVKTDETSNESVESSKKIDDVDKVVEVVKEVKKLLMEALDITEEELNDILSDMGINLTDLLVGENLQNFILQTRGCTKIDLLVNENLANLVTDLSVKVTDILSKNGFTDIANFQQIIIDNADAIETSLQSTEDNVDNIIDGSADLEVKDDAYVQIEGEDSKEVALDSDKRVNKTIDSNPTKIGDDGIADKITVETSSDDGQTLGQEQSSNADNQQIAMNFNQAIDNTVNANANIDPAAFSSNVQEADIIRQIIDQIKVSVDKNVQSMEVQLNPENLGKVHINVEAKDGVMQAKIIAETEAAKNAIENNIAILKENFSNNELKVEAIEVMVAAYGFFEESQAGDFDNQQQASDTSKKIGGINVNNLDEEELTEDQELEVEIMKSKGNTVSYTV